MWIEALVLKICMLTVRLFALQDEDDDDEEEDDEDGGEDEGEPTSKKPRTD